VSGSRLAVEMEPLVLLIFFMLYPAAVSSSIREPRAGLVGEARRVLLLFEGKQ
jgi:hypothetical protein